MRCGSICFPFNSLDNCKTCHQTNKKNIERGALTTNVTHYNECCRDYELFN